MSLIARYLIDKALSLHSRQVVVPVKDRCLQERYRNRSCKACVDICRHDAIKIGKVVEVLQTCTGCGACVAACPSGTFIPGNPSDNHLLSMVSALLEEGAANVIRFACKADSGYTEGAVLLPSLNRLTEALILWAFSMGASKVEIKRCTCTECCGLTNKAALWEKTIAFAFLMMRMVGISNDHLEIRDTFSPGRVNTPLKRGLNRREAFTAFCGGLRRSAVSLLHRSSGEESAADHPPSKEQSAFKRKLLHSALVALPIKHPDIPCPDGFSLATLMISEDCRECLACTTLCPTGALFWEDVKNERRLLHETWRCIGCDTCADACLTGAIVMEKPVSLSKLGSGSPEVLIKLVSSTCPKCGEKGHGPTSESWCLRCTQWKGRLRM